MELLFLLLVLAILVEAVVESVVMTVAKGMNWKQLLAFLLAGFASYAYGLSVSGMVGLELVGPEWLGFLLNIIFAGAILMRGSGFVNDLFTRVAALRG